MDAAGGNVLEEKMLEEFTPFQELGLVEFHFVHVFVMCCYGLWMILPM
jgi:hypothetical protein